MRALGGLTTKGSARVERLREKFFTYSPTVELDRMRAVTQIYMETEGEPIAMRRAKAFAKVVETMPVNILPDELIVGFTASKPRGGNIYIDIAGGWLEDELGTIATRSWDPCAISEEDKRELRETIFPYWKGQGEYERTINGRAFHLFPRELKNLIYSDPDKYPGSGTGIVSVDGPRYVHCDHITVDYLKVIRNGLLGFRKEVQESLASLDLTNPEDLKKMTFLESVLVALDAASTIGSRFADKAKQLARRETNPKRKKELEQIADVCVRVPVGPAKTFREALQSLWFTHILLFWESVSTAVSPGRCDQYLYPYYKKDIEEGEITKEEAQELIDCFLLKFAEAILILPAAYSQVMGGYPTTQQIDVGGVAADGGDATNDLSFMFIEGMMHTRLMQPTFGVLLHSRTPEDFLIKACELASLGTGHPSFFNAETIILSLVARGTRGGPPVPLELAREKMNVASCVSPCISGLDNGSHGGLINAAAAIELTLTNGVSRLFQKKVGVETGNPRTFKCFGDFMEAVKKQLAWLTKNLAIGNNVCELAMADLMPTPYQSALIGDCIEKGLDKQSGGARYNFGYIHDLVGICDVADSLAAIKKLVFDENKIGMDELCAAVDKNFEGYERLRQLLLNAPKWGNDDDYVDSLAVEIAHFWAEEVYRYKNLRGGYQHPDISPASSNVPFGMVDGALPSGRMAGEVLAEGCSAYAGMDRRGPLSALRSYSKLNHAEVTGGTQLNMKIDPTLFSKNGRAGFKIMADLLRAFVDLKMMHIQFNVVSSDTLRTAQKEPQKFRDLVVKVAGYNAFFVELDKCLQDAIIIRTEHTL